MENGFNVMADDQGLTPAARKLISGLLTFAPSLTAFGNTVPTSFLRLVPRQEAPTRICWGECNRSVLVRVPLGWCGATNMIYDANPQEPRHADRVQNSQTVELRSPDGSANVHTLLAGMTLAVLYGLEDPNALEKADRLFANTADVGSRTDLDNLPTSCYEAALELEKARSLYEQSGVFPKGFIDQTIADLKAHNDADLSENLPGNVKAISDLVKKFMHCG
jgi:glutamine synthetase